MVEEKTWKEFRTIGLLWWINTMLHMFGWAIVMYIDTETGEISRVFPARVRFRGFCEKDVEDGYRRVTAFLSENSVQLLEEANE